MPDRHDAVRTALGAAAADHDAIISSAGVSAGDEDHVRRALLSVGGIDFAGLAIKPGKPLVLGHVRSTPFFGLPGNPVAVAAVFAVLLRQGVLRLAGDMAEAAAALFRARRFQPDAQSGNAGVFCVRHCTAGALT